MYVGVLTIIESKLLVTGIKANCDMSACLDTLAKVGGFIDTVTTSLIFHVGTLGSV